jgi:hypothetical protein
MIKIFRLVPLLLLTACVNQAKLPDKAFIPVTAKCPSPIVPVEPHLAVADLKPTDKPNVVIKAYAASVRAQKSYIGQLKSILAGYQ